MIFATQPQDEEIASRTTTIFNKTSYPGYGATLGLIADFDLLCGFGFHFERNFTPMGGKYEIDSTLTQQRMTEEPQQNKTTSDSAEVFFNYNARVGRFMAQVQFGLDYEYCFCDRYSLIGMIAWERQVFFDQTNWLLNRDIDQDCINDQAESFSVQGLVVRLGFSF